MIDAAQKLAENSEAVCNCFVPALEGAGNHSPNCSIFADECGPTCRQPKHHNSDCDEPQSPAERHRASTLAAVERAHSPANQARLKAKGSRWGGR